MSTKKFFNSSFGVKQKAIPRRFDSISRECRQILFCGFPESLRLRFLR